MLVYNVYLFVGATYQTWKMTIFFFFFYRRTYVLLDGVSHTKGSIKDPKVVERYISLSNGSQPQPSETIKNMNPKVVMEEASDKKKVD